MKILLPPSIWILVKPAYTASLILFRIVGAFAIKTDDIPKFNADAWIKFPSQLQMIKPPATPCDDFDPSKFSLMNPPCGFLQATQ